MKKIALIATMFILSISISKTYAATSDFYPTSGIDKSDGTYYLAQSDLALLSASDDHGYITQNMWNNKYYNDSNYIEFGFTPSIPPSATITCAVISFEWQRAGICQRTREARLTVWDYTSSSWVTENFAEPLPRPGVDRTETKNVFSYINTVEDVNNLKIWFQQQSLSPPAGYTKHDLVKLTVCYESPCSNNCDDYDCSPNSLICEGIGTNKIKEVGDDYSCINNSCVKTGTKECSSSWVCSATTECAAQSCDGSNYKCYYQSGYVWGTVPSKETNCDDGHDNDCDGLTDYKDFDCNKTVDNTPPTWPDGARLTVTYNPYDKDGNITLSWPSATDASGIDYYNIYVYNSTSFLSKFSTSQTSYQITNLADGFYTFNVTAVDKAGNENLGLPGSTTVNRNCSVDVTCTPPAPTTPTTPTGGPPSVRICTENWNCTNWSACSPENVQTRICTDRNDCKTTVNKPRETNACTYTPPAYCGDSICQSNENCSSCPNDCDGCLLPPIGYICGNKICEANETCVNCLADCGDCPAASPLLAMFSGLIAAVAKNPLYAVLLFFLSLAILMAIFRFRFILASKKRRRKK